MKKEKKEDRIYRLRQSVPVISLPEKKQALFKLRYIKDAMLRKRERKKSKLKDREVKRKKETARQTDR